MQKVNYQKIFELYWMSLRYSFWGLKIENFKLLKRHFTADILKDHESGPTGFLKERAV